jgi:hypothetical protein
MVESQLVLNTEECEFLAGMLEIALKNARIEEHRTRTLSFREHVLHNEELITGLLKKLGKPAE